MELQEIEKKIFYFKEGVVINDVEHERMLAIEIIDALFEKLKAIQKILEK